MRCFAAPVFRDRSSFPDRPIFRAAAALCLALVLSGCGGHPDGAALTPTTLAAVDGTSMVDMLVATSRAKAIAPAQGFSGERGEDLGLNRLLISIPPESARKVGEIQWPDSLPADPAKSFAVVSDDSLSISRAEEWFRRSKKRRILVFVHGFNTRYDEAVFRFAQFVHDSGTDFAPVLFTWPSRGTIWDYAYDRESTTWSRDRLEKLLRGAVRNPEVGEVTILAHSMGSWLAMETLREMAIHDGSVPSKIANVILASPDLDVDVFSSQVERLGPKKPRITLFVSRDDHALELSKRISGGVDRLGAIDIAAEPYRSQIEKGGVTVLDLTALQTGDRLNHGKFAESPEVVRLLGQRLIAGQPISDSHLGLGDRIGASALGAAGTVGSAAGLVVSAPLAVVDSGTRKNFGGRFGNLGSSALDTLDPLSH